MRAIVIAALALSTGGCTSWWPWGGSSGEVPRVPPGATAYKCDGGKELFVRYLEGGKSAMIVFPEREFRLDRVGDAGGRYSNGRTTLTLDGGAATLQDGSAATHTNCKPAT
ncbi:MAG: MliC family protein [Burkholderiales bacterium]|nr:MliC family protein [Burkholderiales bacterium]